jgi:hypothetical protein
MPPLTSQTLALLLAIAPEKGKSSTARTDALYASVEPLQEVLEDVLDKLSDVDKLRRAADRAEDNPEGYVFFERIKQTVDAAQRQVREALAIMDALTDTLFQLDKYGADMRASLETHDERMALAAQQRAGRVIISQEEYDRLRAAAARGQEIPHHADAPGKTP